MSPQESDNLWWDAFATEFFEEDASLTLSFCLEDGPKRYSKLLNGLFTLCCGEYRVFLVGGVIEIGWFWARDSPFFLPFRV